MDSPSRFILIKALIFFGSFSELLACSASNKDVGVCLHSYLERDFMSLESIVYSRSPAQNSRYRSGRSIEFLDSSWLEGPELDDYCKCLKDTLNCFTDVLENCGNINEYYSYQHLINALNNVHSHLCSTPSAQRNYFLGFLRAIECAENARFFSQRCHMDDVPRNIWNKILRLEVGTEVCDSLIRQRNCMLRYRFIERNCRGPEQFHAYRNISKLFLADWCSNPDLTLSGSPAGNSSCWFLVAVLVFAIGNFNIN